MRRTLSRVVLAGTVLAGALALASAPSAQDRTRFRDLDRNHDGVVSRAEWPGGDQSFRDRDRNGDGFLTRQEMRGEAVTPREFAFLDFDNNGEISRDEWIRGFSQLDLDGSGFLTESELQSSSGQSPEVTRAFQAGRERGLADGRQAGREDRDRRGAWDLDGQRELEQADAGYRAELGPRDEYQAGYREGFRQGYSEGFGPRR